MSLHVYKTCKIFDQTEHHVVAESIHSISMNLSTIKGTTGGIKVINHCIFRNFKAFLHGEEHQMYFCMKGTEGELFFL